MSNNDDKSKKVENSFRMLSQKMNEIQKTKKPVRNPATSSLKTNNNLKAAKSPENLNSSNSSIIELDMSQPGSCGYQSVDRDPDVPDRSYGDYFCPLCDSHMNSDGMWQAHIAGKRHMKNVDKGNNDPKYDDLDVESVIKQEIKNVKDPIIGLSYIHEIRRKDKGAPPIFTCFLCQATFPTVPLTIEHILTMKHRMNFMKENSPDDFQLLDATNLKKGHMEPLVEEMTIKLEKKFGKGAVKVKQEKLKIPPAHTYSSRKFGGSDDEEEKRPRKKMKPDDKDFYTSKRVQQSKNETISEKYKYNRDIDRRRRYPSSEDEDTYRQYSPSRRPHSRSDYYEDIKRYGSPLPRDSYKKESVYAKRVLSPERPFHPRTSPPREPVVERNNYKTTYGPEPPPSITYPSSSSHQYDEKSHRNISTPNQPMSDEKNDSHQQILEFLQKLLSLPTEFFFAVVLKKMDQIERNSEGLSIILKLYKKAEMLLKQILPHDLLTAAMQRASQSENASRDSPQSTHPIHDSSTLPNRPRPQGDFSFIKEFLDCRKSPTVVSSPVQPSVGGGAVGVPPLNTPSYANQNFGNLNQTYGSSSHTYVNSSLSHASPSLSHASSSLTHPSSSLIHASSSLTHPSSSLIHASSSLTHPSSSHIHASSSHTPGSSSQTYGNQPSLSTRGNVNSYQSRDSSLQSYASSFQNNSASSFQNNSYNATSSSSSGIPGLTLAEEDNRERQNYSYGFPPKQSSHYPSYGY